MTFFPNKLYSNSIHVEHENFCEKKKKKKTFSCSRIGQGLRAHLLLCIYTQQKKKKKEIFEPRSMKKKIKKVSNKEIGREFMQI